MNYNNNGVKVTEIDDVLEELSNIKSSKDIRNIQNASTSGNVSELDFKKLINKLNLIHSDLHDIDIQLERANLIRLVEMEIVSESYLKDELENTGYKFVKIDWDEYL